MGFFYSKNSCRPAQERQEFLSVALAILERALDLALGGLLAYPALS